jgi:ElaB/YqjD/DUF883 family membrane-anchored ribosome-binding protein
MKTNDVMEQAQDGQSKAKEVINNLKDKAVEWRQTATETTLKAAKATDTCVRENRWMAIGCVVLTGVVLGFLLARRRD